VTHRLELCLSTGAVCDAKFSLSYFIWTGVVLYAVEKLVWYTWNRRANLCWIFIKFGIEVLRRNLSNPSQFNDSQCGVSRTAPEGLVSQIFHPIWLTFGTDIHKILFSNCEFRENRCCECHNLLRGENAFLSALSKFVVSCW
jgi:hypothetical protein